MKSCVLLAGLGAEGDTVVREPVLTRLPHRGAAGPLRRAVIEEEEPTAPTWCGCAPSHAAPFELDVPGDPSQAAFWVVAACVVPGSAVTVERVYVGRGRRGFLDVLARMGADIEEVPATGPGDLAATADVAARYGAAAGHRGRRRRDHRPRRGPRAGRGGGLRRGDTVFRGVGELRVKESDRLAGVAALVRAFGAGAEVDGDDLVVHGRGPAVARAPSTPAATTAWPWPRPWPAWRPGHGTTPHHGLGGRGHQLPGLRRPTSARLTGPGRR